MSRSSIGSKGGIVILDDVDIDGSERNSISLSVLSKGNDDNNNSKSILSELLLPSSSNSKYIKMEKGVTEVSKEMWKKHLIGLYAQ